MRKILVYDLPTRIFHWSFSFLFVASFFIAKSFDDESSVYPYHMIMGIMMAVLVLLRIFWGLVGSKYARFSSYRLNPTELLKYLKDIVTGKTVKYIGHNPASSWAAVIMMFFSLGLSVTGYMMTQKIYKESVEEIHEFLANGFLLVVLAHIAGVLFHTFRHKDAIGLSMLSGNKSTENNIDTGIPHSHKIAGFVTVALLVSLIFGMNKSYDPQTQVLKIGNTELRLGEAENDEGHDERNLGTPESKFDKNDHDDDE